MSPIFDRRRGMRDLKPTQLVSQLDSIFSHELSDHFQRKRCLGPESILLTLLGHLAHGKQGGYDVMMAQATRLFGDALPWITPPAASSFCRARRKMNNDELYAVYGRLYQAIEGTRRPVNSTVGGKRLVAIDAAFVNLPATQELIETFGQRRIHNGVCHNAQAQLVVLWDVLAHMPITWALLPCNWYERDALWAFLDVLGPNDLVIADRAYPARNLLKAMNDRSIPFICRLNSNTESTWREAKAFMKRARKYGITDADISMRTKTWGDCPLVPLRMVKGRKPGRRQRQKGRQERLFITNLPRNSTFSKIAIEQIYCQRWMIEVAFREMKHQFHLEQFCSKSAHGIEQEIIAFMIFWMLNAGISRIAYQRRWQRRSRYGIPHDQAAVSRTCVTQVAIEVLRCSRGNHQADVRIDKWFEWLDRKFFRRRIGRSFPRVRKSPLPGWQNQWRNYYDSVAA